MMQLEESSPAARRAGLKSVRGDGSGAMADLEHAVAAGKTAKQPARKYRSSRVAIPAAIISIWEIAPRRLHRQSLATYPNYYRASAGMAQVRVACGSDMMRPLISTVKQSRYYQCPNTSPR